MVKRVVEGKISEEQRLATLESYRVIGNLPDPRFDVILNELLVTCDVKMAKVAFIDADTTWLKSNLTATYGSMRRVDSIAAQYIVAPVRMLVVPNVDTADPDISRLIGLIPEQPIKALAGVPLVAPNGAAIGAVLVYGQTPRDFTMGQIEQLTRAARKVIEHLETTRAALEFSGEGSGLLVQEDGSAEISPNLGACDGGADYSSMADNSKQIVEGFVTENLRRAGWWAAQIWWAEDDELYPDPWILDESAPGVMTRLRNRSGAVPIKFQGIDYPTPTLIDAASAPWLGNIANIVQAGVRHLLVLDVVGMVGMSLRLVFVVPQGSRVQPETLSALETASLLLPKVIRQEHARGELLYRSTHDPLTGLLNRRGLDQVVLPLGRGSGNQLHAVMYLDLDHFKQVNDTHGHHVGDQLLKYVSERIQAQMRPTDSVSRLGGDEFLVVAKNVAGAESAYSLGRRLLSAINGTFTSEEGIELAVAASLGIALWRPETVFEDAVRIADALMYQAKRSGGLLAVEEASLDATAKGDISVGVKASDLNLVEVEITQIMRLDSNSTDGFLVDISSPLRTVDAEQTAHRVLAAISELQGLGKEHRILIRFGNHFWNHSNLIPNVVDLICKRVAGNPVCVVVDASLIGNHLSEPLTALAARNDVCLVISGFGVGSGQFEMLEQLHPTGLAVNATVLSKAFQAKAESVTLIATDALARAFNLSLFALDLPNSDQMEFCVRAGIKFASIAAPKTAESSVKGNK